MFPDKTGAKRRIFEGICQVFFRKKWGILIKRESESLIFMGLEIPMIMEKGVLIRWETNTHIRLSIVPITMRKAM